ncbi:alcohol dehydrogenase family protein [Roseibium alexandrii]|uniref:Crotonyl-CoA reductase n=1 Tax=Roseibium alexandrii TaxID=388408 RepID=A0A0M6ZTQ9_9HYPH|nr:alcohol dehydrogenase family protein [Roseibium alexandrii]CTQ65470.1 Crotonyl-CoA reductase [Roseibium alexandrii]
MSIPATMKAMVLEGHGGLDKIVWHEDWPTPEPGDGEVLIKVGACGLNNTDVNTRSGWYSKTVSEATTGGVYQEVAEEDPTWGGRPITFPRIQGADTVGTVVALGEGVSEGLLNKRVMVDCWLRDWSDPDNMDKTGYFGSECNGGFAEYTVVDARNVGTIDSELSDAELATFSCSYTTAEGMLSRANVGAEDTVLVTGASGGVGSALVQLAKRRGATVIALASPAKHPEVKALCADHVLDRAPADLKAALKSATGKDMVSVVADIVGGAYWGTLIDVLKRGGRYTCSGAIAGPIVELDLRTFYLRDLTFTGSTVIATHIFPDVVGYIERGEIRPALAATYPLKDFHAAQTAFIEKKHTGNIVVTP